MLLFPFWQPKLVTLPSKFFQLVAFTSAVGYHLASFPTCKTNNSCKLSHIKEGLQKCLLKCRCMSFSIQKLRYSARQSTALRNGRQWDNKSCMMTMECYKISLLTSSHTSEQGYMHHPAIH